MTALSLCIMAGGFSEYAAPNRAKIIRKNGERIETIEINLHEVRKGNIHDMELKPGDRIFIPRSWL